MYTSIYALLICTVVNSALYFIPVFVCFSNNFDDPARSALFELRRAPGPRVSGWSEAHRDAVLHERRCHALHPDKKRRGGKGRSIGFPLLILHPYNIQHACTPVRRHTYINTYIKTYVAATNKQLFCFARGSKPVLSPCISFPGTTNEAQVWCCYILRRT